MLLLPVEPFCQAACGAAGVRQSYDVPYLDVKDAAGWARPDDTKIEGDRFSGRSHVYSSEARSLTVNSVIRADSQTKFLKRRAIIKALADSQGGAALAQWKTHRPPDHSGGCK